jgi:hypothetical protein
LTAIAAGAVAFWMVGLALLQISRLRSSGTLDIQNAIGVEGKIYLRIPGERAGTGTVTASVQGRRENFKAVTDGPTLETGQFCRVTGVHGEDTLLVEKA